MNSVAPEGMLIPTPLVRFFSVKLVILNLISFSM